MATKTWARSSDCQPFIAGSVIAELHSFDSALIPGKDVPAFWSQDVTGVAGVAIGWVYGGSSFAAPTAAPPTQAQLIAYANEKQVALRDGGITVNIGTASAPVEVDVASDVVGRGLVSGCVQLVGLASQSGQPAPTFPWINGNGTQLTLTSAQMMTIATALGNFVQATYAALGGVLAEIPGTITTIAGVDGATWPATAY